MKKTKLLALVMAGVLSLGMLTACSSADSESTEGTEGTENTETNYSTEFYLSEYLDEDGYLKDVDFAKAVTLPDYKNMVVPKESYVVTDDEIQEQVDYILKKYFPEYEVVAVEDGDTVNIDYLGTIDGVAFDGGTYQGYDLVIGSGSFIDDFEAQLVGVMVGETVDVEVTFPTNYPSADVAGKDAVFEVTVNYVDGKSHAPEYTDALVKEKVAPFYSIPAETCDEFNAFIKDDMTQSLVSSYVYNEIIGGSTVNEIHANATGLQNDYLLANYENEALYYGLGLDELIVDYYGYEDRADFLAANAATIEGASNEVMIIQAIAKNENFVVTDDLLFEYFNEGEGFDAVVEMYGKPFLKFIVMQSEIVDMLELETPREQ